MGQTSSCKRNLFFMYLSAASVAVQQPCSEKGTDRVTSIIVVTLVVQALSFLLERHGTLNIRMSIWHLCYYHSVSCIFVEKSYLFASHSHNRVIAYKPLQGLLYSKPTDSTPVGLEGAFKDQPLRWQTPITQVCFTLHHLYFELSCPPTVSASYRSYLIVLQIFLLLLWM